MKVFLNISKKGVKRLIAKRELNLGIAVIGRDADSFVVLNASAVAPQQAVLIKNNEQLVIANRALGTRVNGKLLQSNERRALNSGDLIQISSFSISLEFDYSTTGALEIADQPTLDFEAVLSRTLKPQTAEPIKNSLLDRFLKIGGAAEKTASRAESDFEFEDEIWDFGDTPVVADEKKELPRTAKFDFDAIIGEKMQAAGLADFVERLSGEDDAFSFQATTADGKISQIKIDDSEIVLGWNHTGKQIVPRQRAAFPRATVYKDWSGIYLKPVDAEAVWLDGNRLTTVQRLRHGDRITFQAAFDSGENKQVFLEFIKPQAVVEIEKAILQPLPTVSQNNAAPPEANDILDEPTTEPDDWDLPQVAQETAEQNEIAERPPKKAALVFGFFTWLEITLMIVGTLCGAAVFFFILRYF